MERIYNKLVRDNIPDIIFSKGEIPVTRILDDEEYKKALEEKLCEECDEVISSDAEERSEELADLLEVIRALAGLENQTLKDIIDIADAKKTERGCFNNRIYLEKVMEKPNA